MPSTLKDVPGYEPHGGALEIRLASDQEKQELTAAAVGLPKIEAKARRVLSDLELLAVGALSPHRGFMGESDYLSVVDDMRLSNGLAWSLPITLSATDDEVTRLMPGERAAILHEGRPVALVDVDDIYRYDVRHEAEKTYRTSDRNHPGVAYLYSQGPYYVGGEVTVLENVFEHEFAS
jgi:sulfate adenylyltransferase